MPIESTTITFVPLSPSKEDDMKGRYRESTYLERDRIIHNLAGEVLEEHCLGEECPYYSGGINHTGESHQLHLAMCSGPRPLGESLIAVLTLTPSLLDPIKLPFKRPCLDE